MSDSCKLMMSYQANHDHESHHITYRVKSIAQQIHCLILHML
jgi:hypothetical protein